MKETLRDSKTSKHVSILYLL